MASRKRSQQARAVIYEEEEDEEKPSEPKRLAPKIDECVEYTEIVSLAFDPKRVLLRRIFFINEDKSKYVSIG
jgi:hypothetical protein